MNKQQFEKLRDNLHDHHIKGIGNACTRSPVYLVKKKVIDWGYEEEYAERSQIYCSYDESSFDSVKEFVDDYSDDGEWEYVFENTDYEDKNDFLLCHKDLYDVYRTMEELQPYNGWMYLHGRERWETVEIFLTKEGAEEYIEKRGIRGENCMIYVDSLWRSYEFVELLEGVAKGEIIWGGEDNA